MYFHFWEHCLKLYPILNLGYLISCCPAFAYFMYFRCVVGKIFSHSVGCCMVWMMVSFTLQKLLSSMKSSLLIVDLSACVNGVLFKKSFLVLVTSRLFPTFYSIRFNVSGLMLSSLIYLDFSSLQVDKCRFICSLLHAAILFE